MYPKKIITDIGSLGSQMAFGVRLPITANTYIEFQGYQGRATSMAKFYKSKNGRYKTTPDNKPRNCTGYYDILIVSNNSAPTHEDILKENIETAIINDIYLGEDPDKIQHKNQSLLHVIQLLFIEQEINRGPYVFQDPCTFNTGRDFFTHYLLRASSSPNEIDSWVNEKGILLKNPKSYGWYFNQRLNGDSWITKDIGKELSDNIAFTIDEYENFQRESVEFL